MAAHSEMNDRGNKRKKKRSHIQMAKKFARRRNHGSDLDSDTYQYMVRVLDLMREGFPSLEEKLIFVNNIYEESKGHEVEYAKNQVGSRVLDSLLPFASLDVIQRLVDAFGSSMRSLSSDRFASHVLQKIVLECADRGNQNKNAQKVQKTNSESKEPEISEGIEVKDSDIESYNNIVIKMSKYFINNIEEFVFDTYANHLLRTVIECLGGLIDKSDRKKTSVCSADRRPVVEEFKSLLKDSCRRLYKWPQFLEFGRDGLTSALLQSVLYSLKDIDSELVTSFITKIINECFKSEEEDTLSIIFYTESSIRLLEACLAVAEPETFAEIYKKFFAGKLKQLSLTQNTNFSVQRLLDHSSSKEIFEEIFEEISEHFQQILEKKYLGILSGTANACLRVQTKQGPFINAIMKMLDCETTVENQSQIVLCISTLETKESLKDKEYLKQPINLHGSLIIQAMLKFNKPIKIINSLLDMDKEELLYLISNPKGSHIVDAFMDSKYIGEKSREKLAKKLQKCWAQLAQSTHGSRCLDKIWMWSHGNQRQHIMAELAATGESLRSTTSGKIISNKLNVPLFARSKQDWLESQEKAEKTKALFADIIGKPKTK